MFAGSVEEGECRKICTSRPISSLVELRIVAEDSHAPRHASLALEIVCDARGRFDTSVQRHDERIRRSNSFHQLRKGVVELEEAKGSAISHRGNGG